VDLLAGPYAAAAALLVVAGGPKVVKPGTAVLALRSARLPSAGWLVRLLGAVEVAIGTAAITLGGSVSAALVATSYIAFAAFVVLALTRGGVLASCGCFGTPDTPPTKSHVVFNVLAAGVAAAVALRPAEAVRDVVADQPLAGLPFLALTATCVWFAYLALATLPTLRPKTAGGP
jgi:hypothetical protein